ncbi:hypothetical protein BRC97_07275 [Halobacteriales archaeon QS_6_71_20]|nr:MAG: hypothetical protein BRC97_07275 [Halobacteriales archaeon QS_6_71_20]
MRRTGAALALGGIGATGGCLGVITGSEPAEFSANLASVPDSTLESTGFEEYRVEPLEITREFEVAGQTREVVVTNQLAQYDKAAEVFGERLRASLFVALSTPAVEIAGRTFNPVGDLSTRELAQRMLTRYDDVQNLSQEGEDTVPVLGTDTTVGLFTADATVAQNVTTEVTLHVAEAVRSGPDFVVAVGAYPSMLSDQGDDVRTMLRAVDHDGGG